MGRYVAVVSPTGTEQSLRNSRFMNVWWNDLTNVTRGECSAMPSYLQKSQCGRRARAQLADEKNSSGQISYPLGKKI
jgi:hypothetical protein